MEFSKFTLLVSQIYTFSNSYLIYTKFVFDFLDIVLDACIDRSIHLCGNVDYDVHCKRGQKMFLKYVSEFSIPVH